MAPDTNYQRQGDGNLCAHTPARPALLSSAALLFKYLPWYFLTWENRRESTLALLRGSASLAP